MLFPRLKVYKSVLQIEGWWIRMKNRKVFRVLKDAICAAVSISKLIAVPPPPRLAPITVITNKVVCINFMLIGTFTYTRGA